MKAVDGIPLAIEQAGAILQEGVAIDEFLSLYETQYRSVSRYGETSVLAIPALNDLLRIYKKSGRYITGSAAPAITEQCLQGLLVGGAVIKNQTHDEVLQYVPQS